MADGRCKLVGSVRGDEVAGTFDDHGLMVGENPLPLLQLSGSPASISARNARLEVISRGNTAEPSRRLGLSRAF